MTPSVLVAGPPRSGTTWIARLLSGSEEVVYLEEPDNHFRSPYAYRVKRLADLGQYPALEPKAHVSGYAALWRAALSQDDRHPNTRERLLRTVSRHLLAGAAPAEVSDALAHRRPPTVRLRAVERLAVPERPPASGPLVVKSVYAAFSVEWIASLEPISVVIVLRHPLNVISSWQELGWLDRASDMLAELGPGVLERIVSSRSGARPPSTSSFARAAWLVAVLTSALVEAADRHPEWTLVVHEIVSAAPQERLRAVAESVGLPWTARNDALLEQLNEPGSGYETRRVAAGLQSVWRTRLDPRQVRAAREVLAEFPLSERFDR